MRIKKISKQKLNRCIAFLIDVKEANEKFTGATRWHHPMDMKHCYAEGWVDSVHHYGWKLTEKGSLILEAEQWG